MPDSRQIDRCRGTRCATGPVISTWPSARHSISSSPPSSYHHRAPPGQPAPSRVDQRRAGAGAAGERQPGAALPHAQRGSGRAPAPARSRYWRVRERAARAPAPARARSIGRATRSADEERRVRIAHRARRRGRAPGRRPGRGAACPPPRRAGCPASPAARGPMSTLHAAVRQHLARQSRRRSVWITCWRRPGLAVQQTRRRSGWRCRRRRPRRRRGCGCA